MVAAVRIRLGLGERTRAVRRGRRAIVQQVDLIGHLRVELGRLARERAEHAVAVRCEDVGRAHLGGRGAHEGCLRRHEVVLVALELLVRRRRVHVVIVGGGAGDVPVVVGNPEVARVVTLRVLDAELTVVGKLVRARAAAVLDQKGAVGGRAVLLVKVRGCVAVVVSDDLDHVCGAGDRRGGVERCRVFVVIRRVIGIVGGLDRHLNAASQIELLFDGAECALVDAHVVAARIEQRHIGHKARLLERIGGLAIQVAAQPPT